MKVKLCKYFPFHGYIAFAFFDKIYWRSEYKSLMEHEDYYKVVVNHESIHEAQMRDFSKNIYLGGIVFYVCYLFEWLFRLLLTKDFMTQMAYYNISFEREAFKYECDLSYLQERKPFSQWKMKDE